MRTCLEMLIAILNPLAVLKSFDCELRTESAGYIMDISIKKGKDTPIYTFYLYWEYPEGISIQTEDEDIKDTNGDNEDEAQSVEGVIIILKRWVDDIEADIKRGHYEY